MIIRSVPVRSSISRNVLIGLAAVVAVASRACAAPHAAQPGPLRLDRVVLLMRHGVRPPTKDPAMPKGIAAGIWPGWSVAPGYLTPHGAKGIAALGASDRHWLATAGMLPARGCPAAGQVRVRSDSDQRTIATGGAWLSGFAPGCDLAHEHRPQDEPDRLFLNAGENGEPFDPARADAAVVAALGAGGIAAAERAERGTLGRLDQILCGSAKTDCGVGAVPTGLVPAAADSRPKLTGALDRGSTAAQIILLEYADGKPMAEVGWGRATAADVALLSRLHAAEFAILARPPYVAAANVAPLAREILTALAGPARVTALVGHDTNVASLGGLLDMHWRIPGYAPDDPPPGGAILIELLRDRQGSGFVRASFRAQSLAALRRGDDTSMSQPMRIAGCTMLCPLDRFTAIVEKGLAVR